MASHPTVASDAVSAFQRAYEALIEDAISKQFSEDSSTSTHIEKLRTDIEEQDQLHGQELREVSLLINHLLDKQVFDHLKQQVEAEIEVDIDRLVDEEVQAYLEDVHIPVALQEEIVTKAQLLEIERRRLHNSESKRNNALLRLPKDKKKPLNSIYAKNGEGDVSTHFPATFEELFKLSADTSKALGEDYGLNVTDAKERNLNTIMLFLGVTYQMVRNGDSAGGSTPLGISL